MAEFFSLFSSSKGNSICIRDSENTILVDAGGSCRRLASGLKEKGIELEEIDAIFITHEHTDHISSLKVMLKRCSPVIFVGEETAYHLIASGVLDYKKDKIEFLKDSGQMGKIEYTSFEIPHDAPQTFGFTFKFNDGGRLGIATDIGRFTKEAYEQFCGCDAVVLESNYDIHMLCSCGYPYQLVQRIKGGNGHLSNEECAAASCRLLDSGVSKILLAHTSQHSNFEELAYQTTLSEIIKHGVSFKDFILEVAPKFEPSAAICF